MILYKANVIFNANEIFCLKFVRWSRKKIQMTMSNYPKFFVSGKPTVQSRIKKKKKGLLWILRTIIFRTLENLLTTSFERAKTTFEQRLRSHRNISAVSKSWLSTWIVAEHSAGNVSTFMRLLRVSSRRNLITKFQWLRILFNKTPELDSINQAADLKAENFKKSESFVLVFFFFFSSNF